MTTAARPEPEATLADAFSACFTARSQTAFEAVQSLQWCGDRELCRCLGAWPRSGQGKRLGAQGTGCGLSVEWEPEPGRSLLSSGENRAGENSLFLPPGLGTGGSSLWALFPRAQPAPCRSPGAPLGRSSAQHRAVLCLDRRQEGSCGPFHGVEPWERGTVGVGQKGGAGEGQAPLPGAGRCFPASES